MNETSALTPISHSPDQEPESIHTAPISVEWTASPLTNHSDREKRIQEKYGVEPQTGLKERGIRFNDPEQGPAWAVEAYVPITPDVRTALRDSGFSLPENIESIVYLDLKPQESIYPARYRTIETKWQTKRRALVRGTLDRLRAASTKDVLSEFFAFLARANLGRTLPDHKKGVIISELLKGSFDDSFEIAKKKFREFQDVLKKQKGKSLVIVHGHGGGENEHIMGEQSPETVNNGNEIAQRAGNRVPTSEIVDLYNNPKEYAAIIFASCNIEGAKIAIKDVPIVHPSGPYYQGGGPPFSKNSSFIMTP